VRQLVRQSAVVSSTTRRSGLVGARGGEGGCEHPEHACQCVRVDVAERVPGLGGEGERVPLLEQELVALELDGELPASTTANSISAGSE
jgi:hypothetical protein